MNTDDAVVDCRVAHHLRREPTKVPTRELDVVQTGPEQQEAVSWSGTTLKDELKRTHRRRREEGGKYS